jgi:hypothetical protein
MTLWDAAAQARASDRWAECSARWNTAMTDALLSAAALTPDSVVLDFAAGSGDPALTIAERVIRGRVIALDSSRAGLLLAGTHARRLGLGAKVTFVQARGCTCNPPCCELRGSGHLSLRNHVLSRHWAGTVRSAARA